LRLSAWGARELQEKDYRFEVVINWSGERSVEQLRTDLAQVRAAHPRKQIAPTSHLGVPQRLWERLVSAAGIQPDAVWTTVSNAAIAVLAEQLGRGKFSVSGKSMNKEEFVTCGGVRLSEVDFRTMQSRVCSGLFFAGEVLDIDGITGGFNFQAAWTTGRLAGLAMADFSL
jgi:predicted Rossmann fold flavoprotein